MGIVNAHKGSLSFHTDVTGHTVHSSRIDIGVSAVMVAARLVTWLEDRMLHNRSAADPRSPFVPNYTTVHCGMIAGGTAPNLTAAACSFTTEIRNMPEDDPRDIRDAYLDHIRTRVEPAMKAISAASGVALRPRSAVPGLAPEPNGAAEALVSGVATNDTLAAAVPYVCEAGLFQQAGFSTVICGPGDIAQAHQADEFIDLSELEACGRMLDALIRHCAR